MWLSVAGTLLVGLLLQLTDLGPEIGVVNACIFVTLFCRCIGKFAVVGRGHDFNFVPLSLHKLGPPSSANLRTATLFTLSSLILLGTIQFLVVVVRLLPELWPLRDAQEAWASIIELVPTFLEINITEGELISSRQNRFNIELPSWSWFDVCGMERVHVHEYGNIIELPASILGFLGLRPLPKLATLAVFVLKLPFGL
ncbi:unnamed protein product, partial [Symbiodinium pilosum]